jgi:hypothetical protein
MGRNPFNSYDSSFNTGFEQRPMDVVGARSTVSPSDLAQQQAAGQNQQVPYPVALPPHLFIPKTARSMNLISMNTFAPGLSTQLLSFTCPQATKTHFFSYAIYTNAVDPTLISFNPTVNGIRAYPYHGTPTAPAILDTAPQVIIFNSTTTDLSNQSLVDAQLVLNPNDTIIWNVTNNSGVAVSVGVRMVGYVDGSLVRGTPITGG